MKKIMFFLLLMTVSFSIIAQTSDTYQRNERIHDILVTEIADDFDALIKSRNYDSVKTLSLKITGMTVPSYFDNDLAITILNRIIRQYSDLEVFESWKQSSVNKIQTSLVFEGEWAIIVVYRDNEKLLTVTSVLEQY